MFEMLGKMQSLRKLSIIIHDNPESNPTKHNNTQRGMNQHSWIPVLAISLRGMKNLRSLTLDPGYRAYKACGEYLKLMWVLTRLQTLREMTIGLPFMKFTKKNKEEVKSIIMEFRNLVSLVLIFMEGMSERDIDEIDEVRIFMENRQKNRSDLMFYV